MVEIINKDIFNGIAGKRSGKPKGVVIHNDAGSKNATAKWYMETFLPGRKKANQSNLGFAHYYIDRNTITRVENTNNKAWHTANSDGNANYIGYEVCQSVGESEANFKLNEEMTFRQVAEDLQFYGLSANRDTVKLHKQFTKTSCPHRSVTLHGNNNKVQDYFIERVKHYMTLGKTVAEMLKKDGGRVEVIEPAKVATKPPEKVSKPVTATYTTETQNIGGVQTFLNRWFNGGLKADNLNGPATKKTLIKALQTELNRQFNAGLAVDGYWGAKTKAACVTVRKGANGNLTRLIQAALICKGYDVNGFDAKFGDGLYNAVIRFQKTKGLTADGIVGKDTFEALFK